MMDHSGQQPGLPARRSLRRFSAQRLLSVAILAAGGTLAAHAIAETTASAANPSPAAALGLQPVQKDVSFEQVPKDMISKCRVADIESDTMTGWEVTGPDGALLRRFADTNGDKKIDLWSYYNYGIEAYRDIDSDFNGKADQYRWLGNAGTRWGVDANEDGRIESWKRISAEEVSAEVISALADADPRRFAAILATPRELESLGLSPPKRDELLARAKRAALDFDGLAKRQTAISEDAQWIQFAAPTPGLVPEGTDGSTADILAYENVVAMYESGGKSGQLMVGTLVKVDDRWRMVGLPNVGTGDNMTASSGVFFTPGRASSAMPGSQASDALQGLVSRLEAIDQQLTATEGEKAAPLHADRADLVEQLIEASASAEDRMTWTRQLIDTLSVAVQSGQYSDGLARLKSAGRKFARSDRELAAYADYQAIQAEYVVRQTPDADFQKVQEWYLDSLASFVDDHEKTQEAAQAMLQLALSKEFEDKEKEALAFYQKVRVGYAGTEAGEKAAGAVRRLESVGRRIELEGATLDGRTFKLSALRGRPVVVHYWATWCDPCKNDMKLLSRLQARYKRAGLTLVGINVDARKEDAEKFVRETKLPWVQLFEEGGLESSRLSKAFGVQTLPTMMLIDKSGTVVRHNVRAAELDEELEKLVK